MNSHGDARGQLISVEALPFTVERVYFIYSTQQDIVRGKHAHKTLKQAFLCLSGSCDLHIDNGKQKKVIHLNSHLDIICPKGIYWRELHNFTHDCFLSVFANQAYNPDDYIRTYRDFANYQNNYE